MIAQEPARPDTIAALLGGDHERFDALLAELGQLLAGGEVERADYHIVHLDDALRRHIRVEEEILFPVFDERIRLVGPTAVMRSEHRRIEVQLDHLRWGLAGGEVEPARAALVELLAILADHNRKEERILYPKIDAVLGIAERAELVARITRALRSQAR